ncbi:MAG: response regulator [Lachnospiraceae bacterium]
MEDKRNTMLIVDDMAINRMLLRSLFKDRYRIMEAKNGRQAIEMIDKCRDELLVVLLDLMMPEVDGFGVLTFMLENGYLDVIPVIIITSKEEDESTLKAYSLGASDYILKTFNSEIVIKRVKNITELYQHKNYIEEKVRQQAFLLYNQDRKLKQINNFLVDTLSTAVEFRDGESGAHTKRIKFLTRFILEMLHDLYPFSRDDLDTIASAAVLHDIGKIAIPDAILLKPGRLTAEEYDIMKTHTIRGCEILESLHYIPDRQYYEITYDICRHHHERWDGRGYPDGLAGDDIPIWAQAAAVADVYDALTSERVYKAAFPHKTAIQMIQQGECGVFNPVIMKRLAGNHHKLPALMREII